MHNNQNILVCRRARYNHPSPNYSKDTNICKTQTFALCTDLYFGKNWVSPLTIHALFNVWDTILRFSRGRTPLTELIFYLLEKRAVAWGYKMLFYNSTVCFKSAHGLLWTHFEFYHVAPRCIYTRHAWWILLRQN